MKHIFFLFFFISSSIYCQVYKVKYGDLRYMYNLSEEKEKYKNKDSIMCSCWGMSGFILKDKLPNGVYQVFSENDTNDIIMSGEYKNGLKNGIFTKKNDHGNSTTIMKTTYINGRNCISKIIKGFNNTIDTIYAPYKQIDSIIYNSNNNIDLYIRDTSRLCDEKIFKLQEPNKTFKWIKNKNGQYELSEIGEGYCNGNYLKSYYKKQDETIIEEQYYNPYNGELEKRNRYQNTFNNKGGLIEKTYYSTLAIRKGKSDIISFLSENKSTYRIYDAKSYTDSSYWYEKKTNVSLLLYRIFKNQKIIKKKTYSVEYANENLVLYSQNTNRNNKDRGITREYKEGKLIRSTKRKSKITIEKKYEDGKLTEYKKSKGGKTIKERKY